MSGLDDTPPLSPRFKASTDHMTTPRVPAPSPQAYRAQRRKAFFERRGVPHPAPRPSWAQEVDRRSFDAGWQAAQREARRAAFKAMRQGSQYERQYEPQHQPQCVPERGLRTSFARSIDG